MLRNKTFLIATIILFIYGIGGCADCHYTIKVDYVKSNCLFKQGFSFYELKVFSFRKGMPDSVEIVRVARVSLISEKMKPRKKIYFYKENKNYDWNDINNSVLRSTLPIKMEVGNWYQIRGLVFRGQPNRAAFIKLKEDGTLEVHGYSESKFY